MLYCIMVSEELGYSLCDLITTSLMICVFKKKLSEDFSSSQRLCRIQMREFFKKGSENVAFFYNNL